jgi:hypothetical protein
MAQNETIPTGMKQEAVHLKKIHRNAAMTEQAKRRQAHQKRQ